jgi:hypothetical protein
MRGRIVLLLIFALPAQLAHAQWHYAAYLGGAFIQQNNLQIDQPATNTDLLLKGVNWQDRPLYPAMYYGMRLGYFFSKHVGLEFEHIHLKVYANTAGNVLAQGTLEGAPISAVIPVDSVVQSFSIAHGVNLLLLNTVYRQEILKPRDGRPSRVTLNARIGLGGSLPHAQSEVLGLTTTGHYHIGGFGFQAAVGPEYRIWRGIRWFGEYKYTLTPQRVAIAGGTAGALYQAHNLVTGLAYQF